MKKNKINVEINEESFAKLNVIGYDEKRKDILKEVVEKAIEKEYNRILKESEGYTVKELLAQKIREIKSYNEVNLNYNISESDCRKILNGEIQNTIKGTIVNCPIADDIVMKHKIEKDIRIRKYVTTTGQWKVLNSLNIFIETNKGKYVYVSALNTIKTEKSYEEYINRKPQY